MPTHVRACIQNHGVETGIFLFRCNAVAEEDEEELARVYVNCIDIS